MAMRDCSLGSMWRLVLLVALPMLVSSEIQRLDMLLYADEYVVHFYDGYIRGPGMVDISSLHYTPKSKSLFLEDDKTPIVDDEYEDEDDGGQIGDDEGPKMAGAQNDDGDDLGGGDGGGRRRRLKEQKHPNNNKKNDDTAGVDDTADLLVPGDAAAEEEAGEYLVDIVAFQLPHECAGTRSGCDWTEVGIGVKLESGVKHYCCSQEVIDAELCEDSHYGRLIVAADFQGDHRFVGIPKEGDSDETIRYGKIREKKSGMYALAFANCNPEGRQVQVSGNLVWKSHHGYLPGELFGFMYFYFLMAVIYFVVFCWYGVGMHLNADSRIPIEKWVLMAISLGLLEMFFRTGDYFVWNQDGSRQSFIWYVGTVAGVAKQALSRCLIVMVSLGWGVIRDSLGVTMRTIIVLGTVYVCVSVARDLFVFFAYEDMKTLAGGEDEATTLFDIATMLTFIIAAVDVIFIMWILDALNNTMEYLENNNQSRKLRRYLQLRTIFLFSILFATIWAVFALVDTYDEQGIVREEHEWVVDAATEINYLFVLLCVAYLWRPNPNAKEYAYVMELPAIGGDGEVHELELTGNVPSAMDDEEEDDELKSGKNGYHDDQDSRFQIDDAELA